jgi:hypothetical protein
MPRLSRLCGLALAAWPFLAGAQTSDMTLVMERLDRLERENRALAEEVAALRARLDGAAHTNGATNSAAAPADSRPADPTEPAAVPLDQRVEVLERRTDDLSQTKVETSQKFPIRITGMALFNSFVNSRQNGGFDYPVTASPTGTAHDGATFRQTIIGLEFRGPTTFAGGTIHGNVYMDLFGGTTNQAMRLRYASIEADWKTRSILVGIEKPIFNPREPSSLAQVAISPLTGAGNLWLWLPQVRLQQDISFASGTGVRAQMGVIQTRESLPYPGIVLAGPLAPARPGLEGRFEFHHRLDEDRRIEIAPGFHTSTTHAAGVAIPSNIFSLDWFFNPVRRVEFTGAFFDGKNTATLGNGYGQGFVGYGQHLRPVHSIGGWGQVTVHTLSRLDLHLFSGQQDDQNHVLDAGRIAKNMLFGGNLFYRVAPNVLIGLEATQVRTMYIGQGLLINNHYDLAIGYLF